ncbi:MAG: right-handed parallel beta-helix repeat-containing protein [Melioribacteraceae bacterium]|nr:right-handed parallel beta-helix repeat-containing protein [Melioribacteraceae bacterium]
MKKLFFISLFHLFIIQQIFPQTIQNNLACQPEIYFNILDASGAHYEINAIRYNNEPIFDKYYRITENYNSANDYIYAPAGLWTEHVGFDHVIDNNAGCRNEIVGYGRYSISILRNESESFQFYLNLRHSMVSFRDLFFKIYGNNTQNIYLVELRYYRYENNEWVPYFKTIYNNAIVNYWEEVDETQNLINFFPTQEIISNNLIIPNEDFNNIQGSLTVNGGVTLTIQNGAQLRFGSGYSLIINGTLNANNVYFTRSGSTGTWGGIQFNSGASGTLSYCTIQNAQNGVYSNGYLPNITNSTIANNNIGINLYNTGVQTNSISNNLIQYNTTHGINLTNSSPRNISGNQIYNNGQAGIYCINSSTPYIYNNQITGNSAAGITCALYSPARLGSYSGGGGYNLITGNNWGVGCGYESHAILGTTSGYGYNSIHSNTSHEVKSEYDSNVMAENNWWNRTTPPFYIASDFYTAYGGTIDYNPALSYNPLGGLMKTTSSEYNYDITNEERGFSFLDSELREALNNLIKGQYEEAILIYKRRYKKENDIGKKKYILGRLAECYNLSEKEGFIFFLNNDVRINSEGELIRKDELYATSLFLENMFLINEKKYAQAVNNFEALLKDFPENGAVIKSALYNLVCLNHNQLNDVSRGKIYIDVLKTKYPNDELTLQAMLTIGEFDKNYYPKPELKKEGAVKNELLNSYELLGNYPNPFNPTTTISYIIPESGIVQIKIFDILGKEIATLYDGNNSAGKHSIVWDANSVANGIYFYSIVFNNQRLFKKMLLLK